MNIRKGLEMVVLLVAICVAWWAVTAKQHAEDEAVIAADVVGERSLDALAGGKGDL